MIYLIQGTDIYGRKFTGRYNEDEARQLFHDPTNRLLNILCEDCGSDELVWSSTANDNVCEACGQWQNDKDTLLKTGENK